MKLSFSENLVLTILFLLNSVLTKYLKQAKYSCQWNNLSFKDIEETVITYDTFYTKSLQSGVNSKEIKYIFEFIDDKHEFYISQERFRIFEFWFLSKFKSCDIDSDCALSSDEMRNCFNRRSKEYNAKIISEISKTFNNRVTLNDYLFIRKVQIGYEKYKRNDNDTLWNNTILQALNATFNDRRLQYNDLILIYATGMNLIKRGVNQDRYYIDFIDYFEICRLGHIWLTQGIEEVLNGVYTVNTDNNEYKGVFALYYVSLFNSSVLNDNTIQLKYPSFKYEDFAFLEFYHNIFKNNTSSRAKGWTLNDFNDMVKNNKYFPRDYLWYFNLMTLETKDEIRNNNWNAYTEYDFIQYMFIEENINQNSLFDNLENEIDNRDFDDKINKVFQIGKFKNEERQVMEFEEFFTLLKYWDIYDKCVKLSLNKEKTKDDLWIQREFKYAKYVLKQSDFMNMTKLLNKSHPVLTYGEILRLGLLPLLKCEYVDLYTFVVFMNIDRYELKNNIERIGFYDEAFMKQMNNDGTGKEVSKRKFESLIYNGLDRKCEFSKIYYSKIKK